MPAVVVAVGGVIGGSASSLGAVPSAADMRATDALPASAGSYELQLTAPVEGGLVGWCETYQTPRRSGGRCPVVPIAGQAIVSESWSSSTAPPLSEVVAMTSAQVASVSLAGGRSPVATRAEPGLPYGLRAAFAEIPGQQAAREPRGPLTPLAADGQPLAGPGPSPTPSGYGLESKPWQRPAQPPSGACELRASALPGLSARSGRVALRLRAFTGIIGRPFMSCVDTEYVLNASPLDAGVVLDATHPGVAPASLPNMKAVPGHRGVFQALGWNGRLVGRRLRGAWLLVEGGSGLQQRVTVLEHLRAAIHI